MHCKDYHVAGNVIDSETRCAHYHSELDIIAIKFYCCNTYFPCFQCHEESGCGDQKVWPKERFGEKAVLCGKCKNELTVDQYKDSGYRCTFCGAKFNQGCGLHWELYFEK
jgi:uncharacterized CHY-type Zn-finger protein